MNKPETNEVIDDIELRMIESIEKIQDNFNFFFEGIESITDDYKINRDEKN